MAIYGDHGFPAGKYKAAVGMPERAIQTEGLLAREVLPADIMPAIEAVLDKRYKDGGQTNWETVSAPPPSSY